MSMKKTKKKNFIRLNQNYPGKMFGVQGGQDQWPRIRSMTAFYAFMASEAFFSCTGLGCPVLTPTRRWSCSMKTNIRTVLGLFAKHHQSPDHQLKSKSRITYASLSHAGDHPLMRKLIPSFLYDSAKILERLGFTPLTVGALWTRLLSTSAGAQAVVATVPARREARKCKKMPSLRPKLGFESSQSFAVE